MPAETYQRGNGEADARADEPPVGQMEIIYLGPVAPHWDIRTAYGDPELMNAFYGRVSARLLLLPIHDPQFRRNRERVMRDAERERIDVQWDLGYSEDDRREEDES